MLCLMYRHVEMIDLSPQQPGRWRWGRRHREGQRWTWRTFSKIFFCCFLLKKTEQSSLLLVLLGWLLQDKLYFIGRTVVLLYLIGVNRDSSECHPTPPCCPPSASGRMSESVRTHFFAYGTEWKCVVVLRTCGRVHRSPPPPTTTTTTTTTTSQARAQLWFSFKAPNLRFISNQDLLPTIDTSTISSTLVTSFH